MEGRKLLDELRRTVDALQTFSDIGKTLTSTLDITEVLRVVLQKVSDLLQPTSWSLMLTDEKVTHLRYEILINEPKVNRDELVPLGKGLLGWVAQESKPVISPDPSRERKYTPPSDVRPDDEMTSILCVPLRSKGKPFGVVQLKRKGPDVPPFSVEDLTTLAVIADYSAIAIENARNFARIQELTITDDLTTLYNVRHLHTLLESEIMRASRYKKEFSMIFFDLDRFKQVNDTFGHIHGSQLLRETAILIARLIRTTDYAARYGGDEFVILCPETAKEGAVQIAERIRNAIEKNIFLQDKGLTCHFTASFGVATFPQDAKSKDDMIKMADEAMYRVKNSTRNSVAAA